MRSLIVLFIISIFVCSCKPDQPKKQVEEVVEQYKPVAPEFNADSAFNFVKKQVEFGPRVPNTPAHRKTADWIANTLKKYCDTIYLQKASVKAFDNTMLSMINIIGSFNPEKTQRILLCAHWDTRPFADQDSINKEKAISGANDGGSGVGILLEVARQLSIKRPELGVDIIFFDTEDYGQPDDSKLTPVENSWCLGSQYWSTTPHVPAYTAKYGILLDMVGAPNAKFAWEQTSIKHAEPILHKVWSTASKIGYSSHFVYFKKNGIIDDHLYINSLIGIPTIDIIEYDPTSSSGTFTKAWHTHSDNLDNVDPRTLKAVGQTVLEVVLSEKISNNK